MGQSTEVSPAVEEAGASRQRNGGRRVVYLGKYGSSESQTEYQRLLAELRAALVDARPAVVGRHATTNVTVNEVLLAFLRWAGTHYRRPNGEPTTEVEVRRELVRLALHNSSRSVPLQLVAVVVTKPVGDEPGVARQLGTPDGQGEVGEQLVVGGADDKQPV